MARVIVILGLMIAITALMFWITRKPPVAAGVAAAPPAATGTTVSLAELKSPTVPGAEEDPADKPGDVTDKSDEPHSQIAAEPRSVTNAMPAATSVDATASAQEVTQGPVAGAAPLFGTGAIDANNNATFNGTAAPGDAVSLYWDDKPISWTTADASGNWSLEFKAPVAGKSHELYLLAQSKDGTMVYGPKGARVVPPKGGGRYATVDFDVTAPKIKPTAGTELAADATQGIKVEKVVDGEPGQATLSGTADAGATVRVLINGKAAGETVAAGDGTWSVVASNTSGKAADSLQVVVLGANGAAVDGSEFRHAVAPVEAKVASAETKDYPAILTSRPQAGSEASHSTAAMFETAKTDEPKKPERRVIRVRRGDSLWRISRRHLGNGKKWAQFYRLNKRKIDNPDLIYPGQTLILPG